MERRKLRRVAEKERLAPLHLPRWSLPRRRGSGRGSAWGGRTQERRRVPAAQPGPPALRRLVDLVSVVRRGGGGGRGGGRRGGRRRLREGELTLRPLLLGDRSVRRRRQRGPLGRRRLDRRWTKRRCLGCRRLARRRRFVHSCRARRRRERSAGRRTSLRRHARGVANHRRRGERRVRAVQKPVRGNLADLEREGLAPVAVTDEVGHDAEDPEPQGVLDLGRGRPAGVAQRHGPGLEQRLRTRRPAAGLVLRRSGALWSR